MSEQSGITIAVDGVPTDLADVTWLEVAPCGCGSGCIVAWLPAPYSMLNVTVEQAAADYYETAALRKQAEGRGFTIKPILRYRLTEQMADCLHVPRYGYERPTPDGMRWAGSKWGRGSRVLHLVDAEAVDAQGTVHATSLCDGKDAYGWSHDFAYGKADCARCTAEAAKQGVLL